MTHETSRRKRMDSDDEIREIETDRGVRLSITIERFDDGSVTVTGQTKLTAQMTMIADALGTRPGRTVTDDAIEDVVERVTTEVDRRVLPGDADRVSAGIIAKLHGDRIDETLLGRAIVRRLLNGGDRATVVVTR